MSGGKITEFGSYGTLKENNGAFAEFLHTYARKEGEGGEEALSEVLDDVRNTDSPALHRHVSKVL